MTTYHISLTRGKEAIVDEETYETFNRFKWHFNSKGYAARWSRLSDGSTKLIYLHRLVALAREGEVVHHIDENTLNNLPKNLMLMSKGEHQRFHALRQDPEKRSRGEQHYAKIHPEKLARGERHWSRTCPEQILRGE